ncbi:MAG: aspartyl protease family protein [Anaerolineae bacterium]
MVIKFDYKEEASHLFGTIHRPVAHVQVQNIQTKAWELVTMLVDSGADYTLFPFWYTAALGIDLAQDCKSEVTSGVGGDALVYIYQQDLPLRVGPWERKVPVGFLDHPNVPPLLGRQGFLDTFSVTLSNPHMYFILSYTRALDR